jgi:membrane protease subunit HflK
MPWNSPGGDNDKDKDPWGQNSGNQGPPDLDDVFRNLTKKFGGIFGGGSSGGSNNKGSGGTSLLFRIGIPLAIIAALAVSAFYIIEEGTRGVVLRFGEIERVSMPGPHFRIPFVESVETVDVSGVRDAIHETSMLTQDENIVEVKFTAQYRVKDAQEYLFNIRDPDITLKQALEAAVREIVGKSAIDEVLKERRAEIAAESKVLIQQILDDYEAGLEVTSVNLQDAQPPDQVQGAFDDAVEAREDQKRFVDEARAYANTIVPQARGEAARILEDSLGYKEEVIANAVGEADRFVQLLRAYEKAPKITRERLYLQAVESVYSNSSKVMVDLKGGNNILYLPLDRMTQGGMRDQGMGSSIIGNTSVPGDVKQTFDERKQRTPR